MIDNKNVVTVTDRSLYANEIVDVKNVLDYLIKENIVSFDPDDDKMNIYSFPYKTWGRCLVVGKFYDDIRVSFITITLPAPQDSNSGRKKLVGWSTKTQISFPGLDNIHTNVLRNIHEAKILSTKSYSNMSIPDYGAVKKLLTTIVENAEHVIELLGEKYVHLLPSLLLLAYSGITKADKNGNFEKIEIKEQHISECLKFLIVKTSIERIILYWQNNVNFQAYQETKGSINDFPEDWLTEIY